MKFKSLILTSLFLTLSFGAISSDDCLKESSVTFLDEYISAIGTHPLTKEEIQKISKLVPDGESVGVQNDGSPCVVHYSSAENEQILLRVTPIKNGPQEIKTVTALAGEQVEGGMLNEERTMNYYVRGLNYQYSFKVENNGDGTIYVQTRVLDSITGTSFGAPTGTTTWGACKISIKR